jgi:exodeoxyribonuclease V alpha subunit
MRKNFLSSSAAIRVPENPNSGTLEENRVSGVLTEIRFYENNYLIGILDNGISIKGTMLSPQLSMEYHFTGRWQRHPTFGDTFVFDDYRTSYPTDLRAIQEYLRENTKWIGPALSEKLVATFGAGTLEVCKEHPEKVAKTPGITLKRAREISAMLQSNEANERLQIELKKLLGDTRVSGRAVGAIIREWGRDAPNKIKENPFVLVDNIRGIGFLTADQIARKVGFDSEHPARVRAGILHVLKEASADGNVCLPGAGLAASAGALLEVHGEIIDRVLTEMLDDELLVSWQPHDNSDLTIYLPGLYESERYIAQKLKVLASHKVDPVNPVLDSLHDDQIDAVHLVTEHNLSVLTGPPGTGKTFVIKRIIQSFDGDGIRIELAAPTGKAAKRMTEMTGMPAQTIHRLLEPSPVGSGSNLRFTFSRNEDRPIDADLIILDEVSMIDTALMASFLKAVSPHTRLILVGDHYQLPSVGPGNVLKEVLVSGVVPHKELITIKRQDPGLIVTNCHRIKSGKDIAIANGSSQDFFFMKRDTEQEISDTIFDLFERLSNRYEINPLQDIQFISPLREKTSLSCRALNEQCQHRFNPNPAINKCRFRVGDKVIQIRNDYELGIVNGDIGYIQSLGMQDRTIEVKFENPSRTVKIPLYDNNLELAYAVTVHKYQGSEAPIVIMPVHRCFGNLITQRNLLYTAISRAQRMCILVGQRGEVTKMIRRNKPLQRYTNLARFLQDGR